MKRFLILAAVSAVAVAKPELYKEQEDFQYARSSSDDGSKSGYYGAQRGNMGGNYERAHNMDSLAQNQMSGLVRQVEGELGDGAKTKAGNVYTAANSQGTYGSGHFDLSNLAGRNFHEGTYFDNLQSHLSQSRSLSSHNSNDYTNSNSQSYSGSRHRGYQRSDAQTQTDTDLQSLDNLQGNNQHYNYGKHSSGSQSQAGFQEHGEYDQSNANSHSGYGSNIHTRLISTTPVRIVLTPGGRVAVPVAAQTYATQGASGFEQNGNSAAAIVIDNNQGSRYIPSDAKHYESSYRYHKKWEKHDTVPSAAIVLPTGGSVPKNSELLEDNEGQTQYNNRDLQSEHSSSASRRYSGVKSSSSQSQYQSNYNSQNHGDSLSSSLSAGYSAGANHDASSDSNANTYAQVGYNTDSHSDLNSQVENLNARPKSYQSSYSYHKSWERQGDPYVIKPASNAYYDNQASQRLTSATKNQGYAAHQSGSRYSQNQADCDENGHIRIARSSYTDNQGMQQQSQNLDDNDDLVQQVQSTWQDLGDLNQHSQGIWEQQNLGQQSQSKWDNLEDLNQQFQNNWQQENIVQPSENHLDGFERVSQQSINLDQSNVEQQPQNNLEDLTQQSQNSWDQQNVEQQTQNKWDNLQDLSQQSQTNWEQQNTAQESQSNWNKFENVGQQSQNNWVAQSSGHNMFEDITQQHPNTYTDLVNLREQARNFLGESNQDTETEQIQKLYQLELNKTDTGINVIPGQKYDNERPYKVETPWDKFDILDTSNRNKSKNEHKTESNEFYWHHMSNNGVDDQQINKLNANGDIISEPEPDSQYMNNNPEQTQGYVGLDNNYNNPNVHYSYSNGFVNPIIYNKRNLNPKSRNSYQVYQGNYNSQAIWRENTTDSHRYYQVNNFKSNFNDSKMSSFWNKLDTIEKESIFSRNENDKSHFPQTPVESHGDSQDSKIRSENLGNNFSFINTDQSQITHDSKYLSQNPKKNTSDENHVISTTITTSNETMDDTDLPQEIDPLSHEESENPQDIGRGDIGTDDFYSKPDHSHTASNNNNKIFVNNNTVQINKNHNSDNLNLSVLGLEEQKNGSVMISNGYILNNTTDIVRDSNETDQFNYKQDVLKILNTNQNQTTLDASGAVQSHHINQTKLQGDVQSDSETVRLQDHVIKSKIHDTELQYMPNIEQEPTNYKNEKIDQQNLHNVEASNMQGLLRLNENLEHQSINKFELHNTQDLVQLNENVEEQSLNNFEQDKAQDFIQQNNNFDQQSLHNFAQENTPNFVEENENFEHSLHNFEQDNIQDLAQLNESLEQQHLHHFEQENVHDFQQQTGNLKHQNEYAPNFVQQNNNLEQQSLHSFGQDNIQDFIQQNRNLGQQYLHTFRRLNQNDNLETQNVYNIGQENLRGIRQPTHNSERQLSHNFAHERSFSIEKSDDQSVVQIQHHGHNTPLHRVGNENQHSFQMEDENLWPQNGKHNHQSLQDSTLHNNPHFRLQKPNVEQQSLQNSKIQNEKAVPLPELDKLQQHNITKEIQEQLFPETIEEHKPVQPQLTSLDPNVAENIWLNKTDKPVEPVTDKPGFWKSFGEKVSNAKNKVVTWFRS